MALSYNKLASEATHLIGTGNQIVTTAELRNYFTPVLSNF